MKEMIIKRKELLTTGGQEHQYCTGLTCTEKGKQNRVSISNTVRKTALVHCMYHYMTHCETQ